MLGALGALDALGAPGALGAFGLLGAFGALGVVGSLGALGAQRRGLALVPTPFSRALSHEIEAHHPTIGNIQERHAMETARDKSSRRRRINAQQSGTWRNSK